MTIYDKPSFGRFHSPFNLTAQPMERLLLIDFKGDPLYKGIELQMFDDPLHGKGLLVILYRQDRKVDVYFEPGVHADKGSYAIEAGLGAWKETSMEGASFEITPHGAQADVGFTDAEGRRIELLVREREGGRRRKPFPLLAPISGAIENPQQFLLVFLYDFYLVRRRGTDIKVTIDGETREPASMPLPIDGAFVHMARYSPEPFIAEWNKAHDGPLVALQPPGAGEFQVDGTTYRLVDNDGHYEIAGLAAGDGVHQVDLTFSPPVPSVAALKHDAAVQGQFNLTVKDAGNKGTMAIKAGDDSVHEICGGPYWLAREGDHVFVTLRITRGWRARASKLSMRILFLLRRSFKSWPRAYAWSARIEVGGSEPTMKSRWTRT
jgi:hypothetical protein